MADLRIETCTRWIGGTIKSNVLAIHLDRETWRTLAKIAAENDQLPSLAFGQGHVFFRVPDPPCRR